MLFALTHVCLTLVLLQGCGVGSILAAPVASNDQTLRVRREAGASGWRRFGKRDQVGGAVRVDTPREAMVFAQTDEGVASHGSGEPTNPVVLEDETIEVLPSDETIEVLPSQSDETGHVLPSDETGHVPPSDETGHVLRVDTPSQVMVFAQEGDGKEGERETESDVASTLLLNLLVFD